MLLKIFNFTMYGCKRNNVSFMQCSILHLVFIGLERFRATSGRVLRLRGVSKRSALTNILIAWTLSAIISYLAIVWWQHHDSLKAQSRRTLKAYESAVEVAIMVANNRTNVIVFGNETETKICQFYRRTRLHTALIGSFFLSASHHHCSALHSHLSTNNASRSKHAQRHTVRENP